VRTRRAARDGVFSKEDVDASVFGRGEGERERGGETVASGRRGRDDVAEGRAERGAERERVDSGGGDRADVAVERIG
jgi:hypothetical protein